jgi:hypothetical protein
MCPWICEIEHVKRLWGIDYLNNYTENYYYSQEVIIIIICYGQMMKEMVEKGNSIMINLIHYKNFCKCYNVLPPSTTIKRW